MNIIKNLRSWLNARRKAEVADWVDGDGNSETPSAKSALKRTISQLEAAYDPDEILREIDTPTKSPLAKFADDLNAGRAEIEQAHIFEARVDMSGNVHKESFRINTVKNLKEVLSKEYKPKFKENFSTGTDGISAAYDPAQYSEFTPIMGGPFNKQLYLYDMLKMYALVFEATNHNPLAKRIINIYSQYILGRGYKVKGKETEYEDIWNAFDKKHKIRRKLRKFWLKQYVKYGEIFIDKTTMRSIDPSTIWDIITAPDNIENVYYYHQQYPTQYQIFTGAKVQGVAGSEKQPPMKYIINQIPYSQVIHLKTECDDNEKRGRSILFPILGWLKRVKDLASAEVIKAWLESAFVWDVAVDGSDGDRQTVESQFSSLVTPASNFVHNKMVELKAVQRSGSSGGTANETFTNVLCFIATCVGIPKEWLNIGAVGGGNRATALVAAEPFTKVVEELQEDMEELLHMLAEVAFKEKGIDYSPDMLEFIFPSVTKDTTTEMIKNIQLAESSGYLSNKTAAYMAASELNITTYDYDTEQEQRKEEQEAGMASMLGTMPDIPNPEEGLSPIHGDGKEQIKKDMGTL